MPNFPAPSELPLPAPPSPPPTRKKRRGRTLYFIVFGLALAVFLYSAGMLIRIQLEYRDSIKENDDLREQIMGTYVRPAQTGEPGVTNDPEDPDNTGSTQPPEQTSSPQTAAKIDPSDYYSWIGSVNFTELLRINRDSVAWIQMPDTRIDYPVVQAADNDKYLFTLFRGGSNISGTLFVDYRNKPGFVDRNTIIYGHHMRNGTMFGDLKKLRDTSFFNTHPYFALYTPDATYIYEIFAVYVASIDLNYIQTSFAGDEEFAAFIETVTSQGGNIRQSAIPDEGEQHILTLSTCLGNGDKDARIVAHARRIETLYD